ncbi:hypothetical protein [Actinospica robiniae]|uniref:hypothetical protein n=1 Tax=Actinospica robiniae TaxID=304901 RepID=UPI00041343A2|nr:hypothetical protein [Actinospica robiniae]
MTATRLTADTRTEFFARFGGFEDGVITGVRLHLPRRPAADRTATFEYSKQYVIGDWCEYEVLDGPFI